MSLGMRLLMHLVKVFSHPYVDGFQVEEETDEETDEEMNTTIMPQLESKESAEQRRNQPGKSLKILTLNQMLSRLPITLAQLKA